MGRRLFVTEFNDEQTWQANQIAEKSYPGSSLSSSGEAICALRVEKMPFRQVERKLLPATCIPVIQTLLAATNNCVRSRLQIQVRLRTHWLNNIDDCRKIGRLGKSAKLGQLDIFRANPKKKGPVDKQPRIC